MAAGTGRGAAAAGVAGGGVPGGGAVRCGGAVCCGGAADCGAAAVDSGAAAGLGAACCSGADGAFCSGAGAAFCSGAGGDLGSGRVALPGPFGEPLSPSSGNRSAASSASENRDVATLRTSSISRTALGPHGVGLGVELAQLSLRVLGHRHRVGGGVGDAPIGLDARPPRDLGRLLVGDLENRAGLLADPLELGVDRGRRRPLGRQLGRHLADLVLEPVDVVLDGVAVVAVQGGREPLARRAPQAERSRRPPSAGRAPPRTAPTPARPAGDGRSC